MYNAIAKKESAFHHFGGESKTGVVHETSSETAFVNENGFVQKGTPKGRAARRNGGSEKAQAETQRQGRQRRESESNSYVRLFGVHMHTNRIYGEITKSPL